MKNLFSFIIVLFGTSLTTFAQDNTPLSQAQFELIKNAVWFYSRDVETFQNQPTCENTKDYAELTECSKGMQGVSDKISKWRNSRVNSVKDLNYLQVIIYKEITSKNYRTKLDEYPIFKNKASDIVAKVDENPSDDKKNKDQQSAKDTVKVRGVKETTPDEDKAIAENKSTSASGFNFWLLIPIILSLIAIGYTWFSNKLLREGISNLKRIRKASDSSENSSVDQRINSLEKSVKSFDGSLEELKEDFNKKVRKILNAEPANQISSVINKPIKETKPLTGSRFAKYADMGDGFSANQLAEEQDNEKIFELVLLDNNKAKFKVVNNRSAQLLALSNPNLYLNKTCIYDSVPTVSSNIITETEGDLKLQGNKWLIVNPTRISFV